MDERIREVLADLQILKDGLNGPSKTLSPLTEKKHRKPTDPRHIRFAAHGAFLHELTAHAELHHNIPQESRRHRSERVVVLLSQRSLPPRNRLAVQIGQREQQRRIELRAPLRFNNREAGTLGVKLERDWLEQDRVVDSSIRSGPIQEPVTNHELNGFTFAVDPPAKLVEFLEHLHRFAGRALVLGPLRPRRTPRLEGGYTFWRIFERYENCVPLGVRLVLRRPDPQLDEWVIPVTLKPAS